MKNKVRLVVATTFAALSLVIPSVPAEAVDPQVNCTSLTRITYRHKYVAANTNSYQIVVYPKNTTAIEGYSVVGFNGGNGYYTDTFSADYSLFNSTEWISRFYHKNVTPTGWYQYQVSWCDK